MTCGIVSTLVYPKSYKGEGSGKTKYIYIWRSNGPKFYKIDVNYKYKDYKNYK